MAAGSIPLYGSGKQLKTSSGAGSVADPYVLQTGNAVTVTATIAAPPVANTATADPKVTLTATVAATLIASNANRIGYVIRNKTAAAIVIGFGFTPTATKYVFDIPAGAMYEPAATVFTGDIIALSVPGGDVMATELTQV